MDTSGVYIKMCGKAEEIQNQTPVLYHGPYYLEVAFSKPLYVITQENYVYLTDDRGTRQIWLPRQDQLQEMIIGLGKKYLDAVGSMDDFYGFMDDNRSGSLVAYEQFWLAFVMQECFHKIWNQEEWVNAL